MKNKALILVVDDNAEYRELLAWILERYGFETVSAKSGRQAVEFAIKCRPDLILMDLNMPDMNGYEAAQAIQADRHTWRIPIVAVSADAADFERSAGKAGFTAILEKPWKPEALLYIVTEILRGHVEGHAA
jgi:two-component system phosphate regulon response regulator PhoB